MITVLGLLMFPLGKGRPWRPLGLILDICSGLVVITATVYIVMNFENIMNDLPVAKDIDNYLGLGVLLVILELARRTASPLFPIMVGSAVIYAYFGDRIPGAFTQRFQHRLPYRDYLSFRSRTVGNVGRYCLYHPGSFCAFWKFIATYRCRSDIFDLSARAGGSSPGARQK